MYAEPHIVPWRARHIANPMGTQQKIQRKVVRVVNIWDILAWFFWAYIFITLISIFITVFIDIFRDSSLSGLAKAGWIFLLICIPFLAAFVYLIARGQGMGSRRDGSPSAMRSGGGSAASEIESAKKLLDSGGITKDEFATIKAKALA
jgi:hypothetical protein